jgi:hypothetical protein
MSLQPHPLRCETDKAATVESFSRWLEGFGDVLAAENPVAAIEAQLLDRLDSPVRLLRWAIVQVEKDRFLCEGAYLRH